MNRRQNLDGKHWRHIKRSGMINMDVTGIILCMIGVRMEPIVSERWRKRGRWVRLIPELLESEPELSED
jgi:hypothetical protein